MIVTRSFQTLEAGRPAGVQFKCLEGGIYLETNKHPKNKRRNIGFNENLPQATAGNPSVVNSSETTNGTIVVARTATTGWEDRKILGRSNKVPRAGTKRYADPHRQADDQSEMRT